MLCGKSQHGKNTVADIIQQEFPQMDFQQISFAKKVKEIYSLLTGEEYIESQEFKSGECILYGKSRRQVLIDIGMGLRASIGDDVWASSLIPELDKSKNYIITDFRFKSELFVLNRYVEAFKYNSSVELIALRVKRDLILPVHSDISEVDLDDMHFPTIQNNGSVDDLRKATVQLLEGIL